MSEERVKKLWVAFGAPFVAALAVFTGFTVLYNRIRKGRAEAINGAVLHTPTDDTSIDDATGAVTSKQGADIILPADEIDGLWDPEHLERLARTYWKSLTRFTCGIVHVHYTEAERYVVVLVPQIKLLTFQAPEYEMDACRGIVRWRIERGLLVSKQGRGGDGYLELDVERHDYPDWGKVRLHVDVEVANFYPALTGISRWFYVNTQSRIHVIACHFFLRRLIRRDLSRSKVGRFVGPHTADETPDPQNAADQASPGPQHREAQAA